jgi:hypothetical protein
MVDLVNVSFQFYNHASRKLNQVDDLYADYLVPPEQYYQRLEDYSFQHIQDCECNVIIRSPVVLSATDISLDE